MQRILRYATPITSSLCDFSLRTPSSRPGNANEIGTTQTNKRMTWLSSSPCRRRVPCLPTLCWESACATGTRNTTDCDGHGPYPGRDGPRAMGTRSSSCCRYWASPSTRCFWSRRRAWESDCRRASLLTTYCAFRPDENLEMNRTRRKRNMIENDACFSFCPLPRPFLRRSRLSDE